MVGLEEALAAERAKRQQDAAEATAKENIGRAVLEALAHKLNAEPIPEWTFVLEGSVIRIFRTVNGMPQQLATWKVDDQLRLQLGEQTTEWITSESYVRVIDEAIVLSARLIVDTESGAVRRDAEIVELPPRF